MALEGQETPDPFFDSGLQMLVDGADEEKLTIQLKKFKGNISKTANFVGMERSALHRKLKGLGIKEFN